MSFIQRILKLKTEISVRQFISRKDVGFNKKNIEAYSIIKDEFADRDVKKGDVYYYYTGPLDEKTRDFCKYMLKLDKVFADYEIEYMAQRLGYDVQKYKGSYNCRHKWVRFRGKFIIGNPPTDRQIETLIEKNINY